MEVAIGRTRSRLTLLAVTMDTPEREQAVIGLHQELARLVLETVVLRNAAIQLNNVLL